jgi:hypothetical protein
MGAARANLRRLDMNEPPTALVGLPVNAEEVAANVLDSGLSVT